MRLWQKGDVLRHRDGIGLWHVKKVTEGNTAIFITGCSPEFLNGWVYLMWNEELATNLYVSENNLPVIQEFNFVKREPIDG